MCLKRPQSVPCDSSALSPWCEGSHRQYVNERAWLRAGNVFFGDTDKWHLLPGPAPRPTVSPLPVPRTSFPGSCLLQVVTVISSQRGGVYGPMSKVWLTHSLGLSLPLSWQITSNSSLFVLRNNREVGTSISETPQVLGLMRVSCEPGEPNGRAPSQVCSLLPGHVGLRLRSGPVFPISEWEQQRGGLTRLLRR